MACYLCQSTDISQRKGQVRDAPSLRILECARCGLVYLENADHIHDAFYENSGMHGQEPPPIGSWLADTDWDDQRRFEMVKSLLPNKRLLDFGCGAAGFLRKARGLAGAVAGVELERRVREHWAGEIAIYPDLDAAGDGYDLVTAFHVVEHLADPVALLRQLASRLRAGGRLIVEVPSSDDALLTLYDSPAFQSFTYWSQHLYLFNAHTLALLAARAGLRVLAVEQYQRYPLSNHLHWLSQGRPGGHQRWAFLDSPQLQSAYCEALAAIGRCDTLIAHLDLPAGDPGL